MPSGEIEIHMNVENWISHPIRSYRTRKLWSAFFKRQTIDDIRGRAEAQFDALRDKIRASGCDSLGHFGNHYTFEGGLSLQQNPDEFAALTLFLGEHARHRLYMEIGSASGGACLFLQREVGFDRLLSIDDGSHPRASEQDNNFGQIPNLTRFIGDSHSVAAREFLAKHCGKASIDVAFIDGDHSYEGVKKDVEMTLPFCRKGALVLFHDTIACDDVNQIWKESINRCWLSPLAEFIGREKPLGIAVGSVIYSSFAY